MQFWSELRVENKTNDCPLTSRPTTSCVSLPNQVNPSFMKQLNSSTDYIILAGPTASGKSLLALDLAAEIDGVIINADSMQVYRDLHILTARPTAADEALRPHRLYGLVDGAERYSVGHWLRDVQKIVQQVRAQGRWPILVGGTGFYLKAAEYGLSSIPEIPYFVRTKVTSLYSELGGEDCLERLRDQDPVIAGRLQPGDKQRVIRALEVVMHTGRPLSYWQALPRQGGLTGRAFKLAHIPDRQIIYESIDRRFENMVNGGGLKEVERLVARGLSDDLPIMRALGLPALAAHLRGDTDKQRAIYLGCRDTRHYAKRQITWLRNNFISNYENNEIYSNKIIEKIFSEIL